MPIVNACLGGLANAIPSGQAKLNLTWITNDGENQQVTFVISGTASKSVQSDANGYASVQLPVGTYTVSVTHGGEYLGDDPKSITLTSRGTFSLTWLTGARQAQTVVMNSPGAITSSSVSYSITLGGTSVASGSSWSASMTFSLYPGEYTLTFSAYGDSFTKTFTVPKTAGLTLDLSEFFCKVTVSSSYSCRNITYRGYSVSGTSSYASSHTFTVVRATSSRSIGGTVNTPSGKTMTASYTDGSSETFTLATYSASGTSVTPNSASKSASFSVYESKRTVFVLKSGTLTIPSGTYNIAVEGGGGSGGGCRGVENEDTGDSDDYGGGGGGAGYVDFKQNYTLNGAYTLKLGAGGKGVKSGYSGNAGEASTFGGILSANGGNGGGLVSTYGDSGAEGGSGESGGGGLYTGGNGVYGGGGGGRYTRGGSSTYGSAGSTTQGGRGSSTLANLFNISLGSGGGINSNHCGVGGGVLAGGGPNDESGGGGGGSLYGSGGTAYKSYEESERNRMNGDYGAGGGGYGDRMWGKQFDSGSGGSGLFVIRPA